MRDILSSFAGEVSKQTPLHGGDINHVSRVEAANGDFVLKENRDVPEDFFQAEAKGLEVLKENGLPVPGVIALEQNALLLEYIPRGGRDDRRAGELLAKLHLQKQDYFGFEEDNYIGSLPQKNGAYDSWAEFFAKRRIEDQISLYLQKTAIPAPERDLWSKLIETILKELPEPEYPSLIQGDLWSGNLYHGENGPVFIDPAVYYADRRVELAFTELFGGFGSGFYQGYNSIIHFPDPVYRQFRDLYQIYPLLVHANLFGVGYYNSALSRARYYL